MSARISKLRKLAKAVVDVLTEGCSADEINPPFTARMKFVPAESVETLETAAGVVVNVAPAQLTSKRLTRAANERHYFIAVQVVRKVTESVDAVFEATVDALCALVEWIEEWLTGADRARIQDDALNVYSLHSVQVVDIFDWELLEESRTFQSVLLLDYFLAS